MCVCMVSEDSYIIMSAKVNGKGSHDIIFGTYDRKRKQVALFQIAYS